MNTDRGFLTRLREAFDEYRAERRSRPAQGARSESARVSRFLRWLTPNGGTLLLAAVLIATAQVWAKPLVQPASAPSPSATTVNYQGRLTNPDGTPVENRSYGISFALYDAQEDGNLVWGPEDHPAVPVTDGLFSVGLGSRESGGIPPTTWNGDRYLEITVAGETLEPRELIRSVPIAGMALTVPDGAIASRKASLTIRRVSASSSLALTSATAALIPGTRTTLSLPVPSRVLVVATCDAEARTSNSLVICELWVNGTAQSSAMHAGRATNTQGAAARVTAGNSYVLELGSGSHTIEMRARLWRAGDGQSGNAYSAHTGYSYLVTGR